MSTYQELVKQIRNTNTSYLETYLNIMSIVCNSKYPSKERLILGDKITDTLDRLMEVIDDHNFDNFSEIYSKINNASKEDEENMISEMKQWIQDEKVIRSCYIIKIALIKKFIEKQKQTKMQIESTDTFQSKLKDLLLDIEKSDEYKSAISDDIRGEHVFILFSDGNISSTKAGSDLFLERSLFCSEPAIPAINFDLFNFPHQYNEFKYAVFKKYQDAKLFRDRILELYK